jgi:hypothetical protein
MKLYPHLSVLDEAAAATSGDRRRDYGTATANHERIASGWNWYLDARPVKDAPITPLDAAMMMIVLKIARSVHRPKRDNFVDIIGYAKCGAQIAGFEPEGEEGTRQEAQGKSAEGVER